MYFMLSLFQNLVWYVWCHSCHVCCRWKCIGALLDYLFAWNSHWWSYSTGAFFCSRLVLSTKSVRLGMSSKLLFVQIAFGLPEYTLGLLVAVDTPVMAISLRCLNVLVHSNSISARRCYSRGVSHVVVLRSSWPDTPLALQRMPSSSSPY